MTRAEIARVFTHIPELETERLLMRRIKVSDTDDMYDYSCRDDVTRWLLWSPHMSRDYTRRYINSLQPQYHSGEFYDWALECRADRHMIGTCGFTMFDIEDNRAEIGYVINPRYWGKGLASEAVSAVIGFGFDKLGLNRIEARFILGNERSRHVMERNGMKFEGIHRSLLYVKGSYRDVGTCALLYSDYSMSVRNGTPYRIVTEKKLNKLRELFE